MPWDRSLYPSNWPALRGAMLTRAGDRCEGSPAFPDCRAANYRPHPVTGARVVLTIAHVDYNVANCDPGNLRAWCQRCHNNHDLPFRLANRRRKMAAVQVAAGQLSLLSQMSPEKESAKFKGDFPAHG